MDVATQATRQTLANSAFWICSKILPHGSTQPKAGTVTISATVGGKPISRYLSPTVIATQLKVLQAELTKEKSGLSPNQNIKFKSWYKAALDLSSPDSTEEISADHVGSREILNSTISCFKNPLKTVYRAILVQFGLAIAVKDLVESKNP